MHLKGIAIQNMLIAYMPKATGKVKKKKKQVNTNIINMFRLLCF